MGRETTIEEQQRLEQKLLKRQEKNKKAMPLTPDIDNPLNCACLIHGDGYDWDYVDRLYSMLNRHLTQPFLLHVYTEDDRVVPAPYVKHSLIDWGIAGPKRSWWYKLQLFNKDFYSGPLLYFDLDTVIVNNIDWIWQLNLQHFWSVRDFKYLWRPHFSGSNSSVMWWNTEKYYKIWEHVKRQKLETFFRKYHGDQDYITEAIPLAERRFFNTDWVKSWRWQCLDGGFNFNRRIYLSPGAGTYVGQNTSILVFHGSPKPHETDDHVVKQHWQ